MSGRRVEFASNGSNAGWTRRDLLVGGVLGLGVLALTPARPRAQELSEETRAALEQSLFVYISPLR